MQQSPSEFRNILCIRADNMGDVIMSGPAMRALKASFQARITLLTSKMGSLAAPHLAEIDDLITADVPWVKTGHLPTPGECFVLLENIKSRKFDLVVIFTVYSQSALPAAMLSYLAGIPRRLAYCRENPYYLLTDWVPDKEPYTEIVHQVERDLSLVESIGAKALDDRLHVTYSPAARKSALHRAALTGVDVRRPWILLHPGVSDKKREYPVQYWIEAATLLHRELGMQLVITGSGKEVPLAGEIQRGVSFPVYSLAGELSMDEFIGFVSESALVISVNTSTAHIAAALKRPLIVLYARTNPQHTPWKGRAEVLPFSIEGGQASRNEVIRWVDKTLYAVKVPYPDAERILAAARKLLYREIAANAGAFAQDSFREHISSVNIHDLPHDGETHA
ncbi:MAG TPA: glycosyltransferase family 9 protein [Puia sp.]